MHGSLRLLVLLCWGATLATLATATVLEKSFGTPYIQTTIYEAWWFTGLWILSALLSAFYIIQSRLYRRPAFILHVAFAVILLGALTTRLTALHGEIHLAEGVPTNTFTAGTQSHTLPYAITLTRFEVAYYLGTTAPADFIAHVAIADPELASDSGTVSMNRILSRRGYRFYQHGIDEDLRGCTLLVAHDPWGIAITYCGYGLLLLGMLLFMGTDKGFRERIQLFAKRPTILAIPLLITLVGAVGITRASNPSHRASHAAPVANHRLLESLLASQQARGVPASTAPPKTIPREVAAQFGTLYVYYADRICPLQTVAYQFSLKLTGGFGYRGLTPEQMLMGWVFFPSSWIDAPLIALPRGRVRQLFASKRGTVSWREFTDSSYQYRLAIPLEQIRRGEYPGNPQSVLAADEKYHLIQSVTSLRLLGIYPLPHNHDSTAIRWYSPVDRLPEVLAGQERIFIRKGFDYLAELAVKGDYAALSTAVAKIRQYQLRNAGKVLPPAYRTRAERLYNQLARPRPLAFASLTLGLLLFALLTASLAGFHTRQPRWIMRIALGLAIVLLVVISGIIALRWVASAHIPLANGADTMLFMGWLSLLIAILLHRHFTPLLPIGFLSAGFALLVAALGSANPPITQLMPVLGSPLLSAHVACIMLAYTLLSFISLNSSMAIVLRCINRNTKNAINLLANASRTILYPALFLLAIGIFIGAIWANVSWGSYWSWDPKETWALITLMVYAAGVHTHSIPRLSKPMPFHIYMLAAFACVLITYFGVNYLLGGMHSYAG
jgi:putative cytochrome c-type biogenesis protein CcsB